MGNGLLSQLCSGGCQVQFVGHWSHHQRYSTFPPPPSPPHPPIHTPIHPHPPPPPHTQMIQYQLFYCALSFIGFYYSYFIFSYHLLDLVMSFKLLRNVLKSVLNNYKQLGMTILMTCVVIYIYTVIAFNFFRKFYRQTSPQEQACDSMFRVRGCGWVELGSVITFTFKISHFDG